MAKTITLRLDENIYQMMLVAAQGARRTISNFIEYAALSYLSHETYVSDKEMKEMLGDAGLIRQIKNSEKDILAGRVKVVA
jgi:hypothetical protein